LPLPVTVTTTLKTSTAWEGRVEVALAEAAESPADRRDSRCCIVLAVKLARHEIRLERLNVAPETVVSRTLAIPVLSALFVLVAAAAWITAGKAAHGHRGPGRVGGPWQPRSPNHIERHGGDRPRCRCRAAAIDVETREPSQN